MFREAIDSIRKAYDIDVFLSLHESVLFGNEKKYLNECIDSTFVSSVGKIVDQFEGMVAEYIGAKYAIATVKSSYPYEFSHDEIGYNYRLPNINKALDCAQMESLEVIPQHKEELALSYEKFFDNQEMNFVTEPTESKTNYWLNVVILKDKEERDAFLKNTSAVGMMTRPIWQLMNRLEIFKPCQSGDLTNAYWLEERVVNIPSGVWVK